MVDLYSVDIAIAATVYVKASSQTEAEEKVRKLRMTSIEVGGDPLISELRYSDPNLPDISLSPAMTLHQPIGEFDLVERGVPFSTK